MVVRQSRRSLVLVYGAFVGSPSTRGGSLGAVAGLQGDSSMTSGVLDLGTANITAGAPARA